MVLFAEGEGTPTTLLGILGVMATGVSALLGVVVKWLLSHITDLTKQSMEMVASRDRLMADMQKNYKDSLLAVTAHCEKEIERQMEIQRERDARQEAIQNRQIEALEELKDVVASLHAKLLTHDKVG